MRSSGRSSVFDDCRVACLSFHQPLYTAAQPNSRERVENRRGKIIMTLTYTYFSMAMEGKRSGGGGRKGR